MKPLPALMLSLAFMASFPATAANLMLDFGPNPASDGSLTLSPGHDSGWIPDAHTSWNFLNSADTTSDLVFSDGTAAAGITLVFGQETTANDNIIDFASPIGNAALAGSGGGVSGRQSLLGTGSIYGSNTGPIHTVGRDGFFGAASVPLGTVAGAIGLRLDGLEAGEYRVYVMARNTNSNDTGLSTMAIYGDVGAAAETFDFSSLAASGTQVNTTYTTGAYAGQYTSFTEGENFVAFDLTVAEGESLFLASDGLASETRGFLNMVQIVRIPRSYEEWIEPFTDQIPDPADRLPEADPDGDGVTNFEEFAFGGHPADPASRGIRVVKIADTDADSEGELTLTVEVRAGAVFEPSGSALVAEKHGVSYTIEGSLDLASFDSPVSEVTPHPGAGPSSSAGYEFRTFRLDASNGLPDKGFLRTKAEPPAAH